MLKEIVQNIFTKKKTISQAEIEKFGQDMSGVLQELQGEIDRVYRRSLRIRQVDAGSCNACEWECTALNNPIYDIQRFGIDFVASPRHADLLLVTGPVSRQMELALRKTYNATPDPKFVIACGDCALDGGIYKGSYAVANGVANVIPVDFTIPGCPPTPAKIIAALLAFLKQAK